MIKDDPFFLFLLAPASYPEHPSAITHVETHISHVFIGDNYVYKVKKPVNLGFADFSTLRKRHFYCRQEVLLNARLAPNIYLGVQPLYKAGGSYSFVPGKGAVIADYAVKMIRISLECLLAGLIDEGKPLYGELDEVGAALSRFHSNAAICGTGRFGSHAAILSAVKENFDQIAPFTGLTIEKACLDHIREYTMPFLDNHKGLFVERRRSGLVRDCHGDLHCEHVCLTRPPIIFDCIEFNKGFRIIDVLEDIAFLFMDLEYKGRFDLSSRLFRAYFSGTRSDPEEQLLRFYKIYRAVVRGKVEGLRAQSEEEGPFRDAIIQRAQNYFHLADHYVQHFRKPFNPVVFMGLSGSGKSTITRDFSPHWIILRSDEIRKTLSGVPEGEHRYSEFGTGIYTEELTARIYRALLEEAVRQAQEGRRVVVDATYLKASQRTDFCRTCIASGLNPFFVHCFAPEDVLRARIEKRMAGGSDVSDAHLEILEAQLQSQEEPVELPFFRVLRLNTEDTLHCTVNALKEFL
jgi:aminoglycoside phosphotransferase family enzyme/predicted kinase